MSFERGPCPAWLAAWARVLLLVTALAGGAWALEPERTATAPTGPVGSESWADRLPELLQQFAPAQAGTAGDIGPLVKDLTRPFPQTSDALTLRLMPGSDFPRNYQIPPVKFTWAGRNLILWGRVGGGSGTYTATWDPGDGSGPQAADVTRPNYIYLVHAYSTFGPKTATLRVTDTVTSEVITKSVLIEVDVANPPQETRYNAAIEDGLRYLYLRQAASGLWSALSGGATTATGLALSCFQLASHSATNDPQADVYADRVGLGLQAMVARLDSLSISNQPACNPDFALPDGRGYWVSDAGGVSGYCQGIVMQALALSKTPDEVAGPGHMAGKTYRTVLANMVDQLAYAQTDASAGGYRGGWRYTINTASYGSSDNSVVQWATIGLEAAEGDPWNIDAAACVKPELTAWLNASQCADGCFGYTAGNSWCNNAKTGAGLYGHLFLGTPFGDGQVQGALTCLGGHWCTLIDTAGYQDMLNGNFYALYSVKKALYDWEIRSQQSITPAGHHWQDEFEKHLIKGLTSLCGSHGYHQITDSNPANPVNDGYWVESTWLGSDQHLATTFALLTLLPGTTCQTPVAKIIIDPPGGCPGTPICFYGDQSTAPEGREIVDWRWDFGCDGTVDATGPQWCPPPSRYPLPPGETSHTYTVCLTVEDDSRDPSCGVSTTQASFIIGTDNHKPVAVPGGPYTACVCDTIRLNACASFDPDKSCTSDSIVEYRWDLTGDGVVDYVTTTCAPDTALVFCTEMETAFQLRVVDTHGAISDPAEGIVHVWTSRQELSVLPANLALTCVGTDSVRIDATINAATQEPGIVVPGTLVQIYHDDPLGQNPTNRICQVTSPNMVNGNDFTFTCGWKLPDASDHVITVIVDPNQEVHECVETDNIASKTFTPGECQRSILVIHKDLFGTSGQLAIVPVYATTDSVIGLTQFVVGYQSSVLSFRGVTVGPGAPGFAVGQINIAPPFPPFCPELDSLVLVQLSGGGMNTFTGPNREIADLRFQVVGSAGDSTRLCFQRQPAASFLTTNSLHDIVDPDLTFSDGKLVVLCPQHRISGAVLYCGTPARPVSDAGVTLTSSAPPVQRSTDADGVYAFASVCTDSIARLDFAKSGDLRSAVGGSDVIAVLQHLAYRDTLTACGRLAADATQDGQVTGGDAQALLNWLAFLTPSAHVGEWRFMPAHIEDPPDAVPPVDAYVLGDADVNWGTLVGKPAHAVSGRIRVTQEVAPDASSLRVTLHVTGNGRGFQSTLFSFAYDAERLTYRGGVSGSSLSDLWSALNGSRPGEVHGALAALERIPDGTALVSLEFAVRNATPVDGAVVFTRALVDDAVAQVDVEAARDGGGDAVAAIPRQYILNQNVPNPFNATTVIRVGIPAQMSAAAMLEVYNSAGRVVRTFDLSGLPAGYHEFRWDGRDARGNLVSSGVYFYRVRSVAGLPGRKMTIVE